MYTIIYARHLICNIQAFHYEYMITSIHAAKACFALCSITPFPKSDFNPETIQHKLHHSSWKCLRIFCKMANRSKARMGASPYL